VSAGLVVDGVSVRYGKATAVDRVSLVAEAGAVTAVVGPNGAGKSSLLQALYGATASTGHVTLDGADISNLTATARARHGIALVPQGRQIFARLSVWENLQIMAEVLRLGDDEAEAALHRFPILVERRRQLAGVLSGGEQQMLAVTRALMGSPRLLLLDEMTTGLAPLIVGQLMETAVAMAASGAIVVVAEPSISTLRDRIDRGYVLLRGAIVDVEEAGGVALEAAYRDRMGITG
jgi:branched-chain amino acid transport system ATP-binding protein